MEWQAAYQCMIKIKSKQLRYMVLGSVATRVAASPRISNSLNSHQHFFLLKVTTSIKCLHIRREINISVEHRNFRTFQCFIYCLNLFIILDTKDSLLQKFQLSRLPTQVESFVVYDKVSEVMVVV